MYDGNSLCDGTWALIPSQIIFLISPTVQCQFHSSVCSELWNIILHFQLNPAEIRAGSAPLPVSVIPRVRVVMETCWEGGNFWWNLPSHQWCSSLCTSELPWISAMPAENLHFRLEDSCLTAKLLTHRKLCFRNSRATLLFLILSTLISCDIGKPLRHLDLVSDNLLTNTSSSFSSSSSPPTNYRLPAHIPTQDTFR